MSTLRTVLLGAVIFLALGAVTTVNAAVTYDAILEWNGPYLHAINTPTLSQMVDDPVADTPFLTPSALAASEHAAGGRDVIYVLDSGHNRIQAFEANGYYVTQSTFTYVGGGPAAAGDYGPAAIWPAEYVAPADKFIVPHSEILTIDGEQWTWVADLTGFVTADKVYTISYAGTNGPIITLPATSLTATSSIVLSYALSDYQGAVVSHAQGMGDIDYGISAAVGTPVMTEIDQATSASASSWQLVHDICSTPTEGAATSDDIFLVDPADNSTNADEKLFYYTVTNLGAANFKEKYDDVLTNPYGVAVAVAGSGFTQTNASVTVGADTGPFDLGTAAVVDRSQVTGHVYTVTVAGTVTITDGTTGRDLISAAAFANLADPFLGIPGLSLPLNAAVGVTQTITTVKQVPDRYLFVADTGADRVKMVSCEGSALSATDDWLPGDAHTGDLQPSAATTIGLTAGKDYRYTLVTPMVQDYSVYTNTFPIKEGSLETVTMDPAGTPVVWNRVDDLATAGPTDEVFQVDWQTGKITFGDGVHGALPTAAAVMQLGTSVGGAASATYSTTPDIIRYGSSGSGPGRFSHPRGIAARWNVVHGWFDVYVADTGNSRIQKFAFHLGNAAINMPAYVEYLCEWNTATTSTDYLSNPVKVAVMLDAQGAGTQTCYVAVADQGNSRVVIYNDTGAMTADATAVPTFDSSGGIEGNSLGQYLQLEGLAWLRNGNDLDLYTCDALRGMVTKYYEAPTPAVALTFAGVSALPQCFSPAGSYTFSFTVTNPPAGGVVDFYYDTASTFDANTATPCVTLGSIPASATSAVWIFADTPDGVPANGTSYYLYARVKNSSGSTVAYDQTTSSELFCMDSSLLPSLRGTDRIDGDFTLYLQNGLERSVNLQLQYPDSCIMVGFGGTFDVNLLQIMGIASGNGWDPTGYTNVIFNPGFSNTAGTYLVNSSITGSQVGLTANGPHNMAVLTVKANDHAIDLATRSKSSTISIVAASSGMKSIHGLSPSLWRTQNIQLKFAYLGDIATTGSGADSTLPNLVPKPDGKINFDDQMVFTLGWNGTLNVQDKIADIGPTEGTVPDLRPVPDGKWDVEDILAFTTMYSWAAGQGYYRTNPNGGLALNRTPEPRPITLGSPVKGEVEAFTVSHLVQPKAGETMTVDLNVNNVRNLSGALLNVGFDSSKLDLISVEKGGFLEGANGSLFFHRTGNGWVEISTSRLDQQNPGVDGSGSVALLTFRIIDETAGNLDLSYDLRNSDNHVISRGNRQAGAYTGGAATFTLYSANPNPVIDGSKIVFSLPDAAAVNLGVYDVAGRLVRTLAKGRHESGYHVVSFNGRNDDGVQLPAGVYFYRLNSAGNNQTRKLIITR